MASGYRSYSTLINEKRLLASSSERVAAWLADNGRASRWADDADDLLELNLLSRNDHLIDLALAEHGLSEEVLRKLFDRKDEVIRAAVLSNQRFLKSGFIRHWTFVSNDDDLSWIGELSNVELEALFSNPALPDHFVADFFEQKGAWKELNEEQRLWAATNIVRTLVDRPSRSDFVDGWADYSYSKVFDTAWRFSRLAPVSLKWAYLLGELYSKLEPDAFSDFGPLETAERWQITDTEQEEPDREQKSNEIGYLGTFQQVRCGLARLAAHKSYHAADKRDVILESADVAIRCGGYRVFRFTPEEIESACGLDGKLACSYLISNENVWKKRETRSALQEACRDASKSDDYVMSASFDFNKQDERQRELHPDWFVDEEWVDDAFEDKPLTDSSLREITERISEAPALASLRAFVGAQAKVETARFWIIVVALAIVAFQL